MKILLLAIIVLVQVFVIKSWFLCHRFADFFHFSLFDLTLRLDEAAHNDEGVPILIVRAFHNKAVGTLLDVYKVFLHYWDALFLANFLSIVGIAGLLFAAWYFFQGKNAKRYILPVFLFLLALQFIEIFLRPDINFVIKVLGFFIPLQILSLFGWSQYVKRNKKMSILLILILCFISILWLLLFQGSISTTYCIV